MKFKKQTWLALFIVPPVLLIVFVLSLWGYVSVTAPRLHPNPQDITSVTVSAPSPEWASAVQQAQQIVRASLSEQNLPGLSVAVGVGDDFVWAEGFGWADLANKVPVAPNTKFRIGSASKVLTSAAVGLLLEKDQLKLDEQIQTYVPAYPRKQWPITLRHLMGHTAGVSTDGGDEGPYRARCERTIEGLQYFATDSLRFEPGTQVRYSQYGWILVSAAVETAANEPFLTFMRKQVFEPLGMVDTQAESSVEAIPNRATFYFPRFAADPQYGVDLTDPLDYSCYAGASAFLSTPSDLVRFGLAMNNAKLLQPGTVKLLQTQQALATGQDTGYGLGWDIETVEFAGKTTHSLGHDGDTMGGRVASLLTLREHGIVVAVTSNLAFADTSALALKIAEVFTSSAPIPGTSSRRR